ncbi:hypothetical protein G6F62_014673 [Rhizopus arrhizus]|nr:hypothetical protein G6F62_014673 [Rhizopus arrhizus]
MENAAAFARRRACYILAGIVIARRDRGGVVAVADVAHLRPRLPAAIGCVVTDAAAEDHMAVGPVAVGVVHRDTRGVLGIERGVQAGGVVEAQLGLIAVARQARQAVAAEARIVSVPEIAEGIRLAQ